MSLQECEESYVALSREIFHPVRRKVDPRRIADFLKANGKFDEIPLEDCIKSAIRSRELNEDALLRDEKPDACKVFVCATRGESSNLVLIRSYETKRHDPLYEICKIWEAGRATSAASTFFEPITIGPNRQRFVDGGLRANNPIRSANAESLNMWPGEDRILLSIGTGAAPGQSLTGDLASLANSLKEIVTDTEQTNKEFRTENSDMVRKGRAFRFNVTHGLAAVGLEEHEAVDRIATYTDDYLDDPDVFDTVEKCVETLHSGGQRLGLTSLEGPSSDNT